jgi:hypothetical protein
VYFTARATLAFPMIRMGCFDLLPVFDRAIELLRPRLIQGADIKDWKVNFVGFILGIGLELLCPTSTANSTMNLD